MSLQLAAQHLASRGRGPDTTLVHMAPQEVAGLQALAKAHGGTLTVNPDTGLPEAGFLSSILPMVAGAFLGPAGLGLTAMQAGLAGAALGTVATGSLQKGLMAGLGAYGGAGLAGSIMGAGTSAGLGAAAGEATAAGTAAETAALEKANAAQAAIANSSAAANAAAAATPEFAALNATPTQFGAFGELPGSFVPPTQAASMVPTTVAMPELSASAVNQVSVERMLEAGFTPEQIAESAGVYAADTAGTAASPFSATTQKALSSPLSAGFDAFKSDPSKFFTKENLQYGLAGLAPVAMDMLTPKQRAIAEQEKLKPYMYAYDPGRVTDVQQKYTGAQTGERTHFNPVYTRTAAGGGLMDIGPVEAMSRSNQSQMAPAYAQGGSSDMAVNPYTGAEAFAEGGDTKAVKPVEQDPYYTMSGQSGDAFKYLMGQTPITPRTPAPAPAAVVVPVQSTVQPVAVAAEPTSPFGRLFGGLLGKSAAQGQGGEWVDADTNVKPYSFDPVTGAFTAVAPKKVFRPYTPAPEPAPVYTGDTSFHGGFAQGGITGSGNLNLNIPLDLGGGQGGFGGAGYSPTGAGFALQTGFNGQNNTAGGGFGMVIDPQGIMSDTFKGTGAFGGNPSEAIGKLSSLLGGRAMAQGGIASLAQGGQSHLGDYSDGGRLLRGPGDGVSDDIPATIGDKRPARLADGEFVVPARIVSELGNGSTEAGARKLYAMMDRVQKARAKTTGKDRVATNTKAEKLLPA